MSFWFKPIASHPVVNISNTRLDLSNSAYPVLLIEGIERQVQLGIVSIEMKTHVVTPHNISQR